jgi:hypothetical protein
LDTIKNYSLGFLTFTGGGGEQSPLFLEIFLMNNAEFFTSCLTLLETLVVLDSLILGSLLFIHFGRLMRW